jgi:hypothetical protein
MIGSLAAAGALVFGAGPIVSRPDLSWQDNTGQLIIAVLTGSVGLIALVALIGLLASVLAPVKVTLENVPADMKAEINGSPSVRLPGDAGTYEQFLANYQFYRSVVASLEGDLAGLPSSPQAGSREESLRRDVQVNLDNSRHNLDLYVAAAAGYLDQAEYYSVAALFEGKRRRAVILAALAGIGALGFQLALAAPPKKEESKDAAYLAYIDAPAQANSLWTELGLASCAIGAEVPVLLERGTGSEKDPYSVTVIALTPGCVPKSFNFRSTELVLHSVGDITIGPRQK